MLLEAQGDHFSLVAAGLAPAGLKLAPGGIASPEVLSMLGTLAIEIACRFRPSAWWIVEQGELVGLCSIKSFAGEGDLEIGYGIAPSRRGRGAARRAVADVLSWAKSCSLPVIFAETAVQNYASRRVLEANGFVQAGARTDDEDGDLIWWRADVTRMC